MDTYKSILIIDDDDIYSYITSQMIEIATRCQRVDKKMSGLTGLRHLERYQGTVDFPELIILDLDMPIVSGVDFLEKYNEKFHKQHLSTKILVVTGIDSGQDDSKIRSFPFVIGIASKPLSTEKLISLIGK